VVKLSGAENKWKSMQDQLIVVYAQTAKIYFRPVFSGSSSSFDAYLHESLSGQSPTSYSGIDFNTATPVAISGIAFTDHGMVGASHQLMYLNAGMFEGGKTVFTCRISDAAPLGDNLFIKAEKVELSVEPGLFYTVDNCYSAGLVTPYVYHVVLNRSNIGS